MKSQAICFVSHCHLHLLKGHDASTLGVYLDRSMTWMKALFSSKESNDMLNDI